jgi:hypothetical protein
LKNISKPAIIELYQKKEIKMSVAKITRDFIEQIEDTKIFTYNDIPSNKKSSVAIELSRLFKKGVGELPNL